jgi:hypothetical protein
MLSIRQYLTLDERVKDSKTAFLDHGTCIGMATLTNAVIQCHHGVWSAGSHIALLKQLLNSLAIKK